jgi:hypothetical protein
MVIKTLSWNACWLRSAVYCVALFLMHVTFRRDTAKINKRHQNYKRKAKQYTVLRVPGMGNWYRRYQIVSASMKSDARY